MANQGDVDIEPWANRKQSYVFRIYTCSDATIHFDYTYLLEYLRPPTSRAVLLTDSDCGAAVLIICSFIPFLIIHLRRRSDDGLIK